MDEYRFLNIGYFDKNLGEDGAFRRDATIPIEELEYAREWADNECFFRTIWQYPTQDYERHAENGEALAPMYFDLDNPDLEEARRSTLNLVEHLSEKIPERALSIYFSGSKGFHVHFPPDAFNLRKKLPDRKSHYAYKNYAKNLKEEYAPDIDLSVYEPKRLFRVVNSKHEDSGLYKVAVTLSELELLDTDEIRELAEEPRVDINNFWERVEPVLEETYDEHREQEPRDSIVKAEDLDESRPRRVTEPIIDEKTPCIESLLSGVNKGERNESAIRLASAFRNFGYSEKRALNELESWNSKNSPPLPGHEIRNTLRSAYRNSYNYGCQDYLLEGHCDKDECPIIEED